MRSRNTHVQIVPFQACVLAHTLSKPQTAVAVATKIALQMNCKMGRELWTTWLRFSSPTCGSTRRVACAAQSEPRGRGQLCTTQSSSIPPEPPLVWVPSLLTADVTSRPPGALLKDKVVPCTGLRLILNRLRRKEAVKYHIKHTD